MGGLPCTHIVLVCYDITPSPFMQLKNHTFAKDSFFSGISGGIRCGVVSLPKPLPLPGSGFWINNANNIFGNSSDSQTILEYNKAIWGEFVAASGGHLSTKQRKSAILPCLLRSPRHSGTDDRRRRTSMVDKRGWMITEAVHRVGSETAGIAG